MARFVNIASVQFTSLAEREATDSHQTVLRETREALKALEGFGLDLVVFCEGVEAYGFPSNQPELAEQVEHPGPYLTAYAEFAAGQKCHVAGSLKLREGDKVFNSIAFVGPEGQILGAYHKTFLTNGEIEAGLTSGPGARVVETAIGRLGGAVCFDLNFDRLRLEYVALKPDILCFASMYHGGLAQGLWAYSCRSFFASALYFHGCGILDPLGRPLKLSDCYTAMPRATVNLDRAVIHLDYNRDRFAEIERKYLGEIVIDIPPNIGVALLYSTTDKRSAMDVVKEFGLQLLDDYMADSVARNDRNRGA